MPDPDPFWDIISHANIDADGSRANEFELASVLATLQDISEASSWISHYLANAMVSPVQHKFPAHFYPAIALLQTAAREIGRINHFSPCQCKTCNPTDS